MKAIIAEAVFRSEGWELLIGGGDLWPVRDRTVDFIALAGPNRPMVVDVPRCREAAAASLSWIRHASECFQQTAETTPSRERSRPLAGDGRPTVALASATSDDDNACTATALADQV